MISGSYACSRGNPVKLVTRSLLPALIASALASPSAIAQEDCVELKGAPPGLYMATDEGITYAIGNDGKEIVMGANEAGFADEGGAKCIKKTPRFMDWPCSTDAAQSRRFATYRIEDMENPGSVEEIVRRYFDIPEVIEPIPNWVDGEYNVVLDVDQLIPWVSSEYWYHVDPSRPILDEKRPKVLLVALYVGLNKVVVDNNMLKSLQEYYGDDPVPVAFMFNDSNTVPVSYFGPNVSLEEILKASKERGIKLADPPLWWLGDYNLSVTPEEFETFFDIPPLEDIPPEKVEQIRADLEANGFSKKPIIVNLFSDTATFAIDQPRRVAVAKSMGLIRIPTVIQTIEPDAILARCGPGTPIGMDGGAISGETTPLSGSTVDSGNPVVPPPIDPEPEVPLSPSGDDTEG